MPIGSTLGKLKLETSDNDTAATDLNRLHDQITSRICFIIEETIEFGLRKLARIFKEIARRFIIRR